MHERLADLRHLGLILGHSLVMACAKNSFTHIEMIQSDGILKSAPSCKPHKAAPA